MQSLANYFRASQGASLYVDLPCLHPPSIIMGDNFCPGLVFVSHDNRIYILKLTVGFETDLEVNPESKRAKYQSHKETLKLKYTDVKFVNLSIGSLVIFGLSCSAFIEMCDALAVGMGHWRYLISNLSNTSLK